MGVKPTTIRNQFLIMENKFIFNENGVCTNPEKVGLVQDGAFECYISVAINSNGKYVVGHSYSETVGDFHGSSSPCSDSNGLFDTKREAVLFEISRIKSSIKRSWEKNWANTQLMLQKAFDEVSQMSLF